MDEWVFFKEVDFSNPSVNQFHIDTRDFHCATEEDVYKLDLDKIRKYPSSFFHTPEEVMGTLEYLFEESGGDTDWRCLELEGEGEKASYNWNMKYIRIFRAEEGLLVCNNEKRILNKTILKSKVKKRW